MSKTTRYGVFTDKIFQLQEAVDKKDKKLFGELLKENNLYLRNCSCGDSYLQQFFLKVLCAGMETFI